MPQGCLKGEDVHASLNSMCGMAVPQLVRVNVEPSGFAPLSADIPDRLAREMPIAPGAREDEIFCIAAAKPLKEFKRRWRYAHSASL